MWFDNACDLCNTEQFFLMRIKLKTFLCNHAVTMFNTKMHVDRGRAG